MSLSTALGLLIGSVLALFFYKNRRTKEGRQSLNRHITVIFYAVLFSAVIFASFLTPVTSQMMPTSMLTDETFVPGAVRVDRNFRRYSGIRFTVQSLQPTPSDEGSFALRHQSWWENPSSEQHDVDCYTARWEWLSWLVQELLREPWYPPLKGYENVWLQEADLGDGKTESLLLLRSGNTVVTVETRSGPIPTEQIDRLLFLLSSDQEV